MVFCFNHITEIEITAIIFRANVTREMRGMVDCPECGKPLAKGSIDSEYCCENKKCPVAIVRCPHESDKMKVAYTSFAREYLHKSKRSLWKI